jgi:hypothetical protein
MVRNNSLRALALLLIALCWQAHAAEISVQTDRGMVRMNEAFTLTFSAQGRTDGNPDFAPLQQDFEIAGTSQNSSFIINNGQAESSSNWVVTVFPKRAGTLTVPPIAFGADLSPELQIEVQEGADPGATENKEVFITVDTEPGNPYVQAQTIVTLRLYRTPNMANENLSQLEFSSSDVIVQPLDEGKNYATNLYGRQYSVHERRYAVFPQQPGLLRIKPLQYSAVRMASRRSFFDMDPFGSASGQPVRIQSEAATLDVRPAATAPWLPATSLKVEEEWSGEPAEFTLGEPLTRKLRITASGLTAEQLPEFPATVVDGFKQYPDQPSLENRKSDTGITGVRAESVAFMPTRAGTYTLPAIEIKWWNTKTGQAEIARLPERSVTVAPSPDGAQAPEPEGQQPAPLETTPPSAENVPAPIITGAPPAAPVWFWLSLMLGLGWLLTALAWWRQRRGGTAPAAGTREQADTGKTEGLLDQACRQHRADDAKNALLGWARAHWKEHPPQSLDAIAARSGDEQFAAQLRVLNTHLYAPKSSGADWDGKALWQAFSEYKKSMDGNSKRIAPSLPPLHKI